MDRRQFLHTSAVALASSVVPAVAGAQTAGHGSGTYGNALVLIELRGGNDGLNTVVPYADPAYYRLRPRIAIRREDVVVLDDRFGLHPSLAPLLPLWQAGELGVVHGLGYPRPNLSHFRSIEIWDTASDSAQYLQEGWLTRTFAHHPVPAGFAADGVLFGANDPGPLAGRGGRAIALADPDQFLRQARYATPAPVQGNAALAHVMRVEANIAQAALGLADRHEFRTAFPSGPFGNAVRGAAHVLGAKAGVAVIRVSQGGYDTHQNQPVLHALLLKQLAEGLVALKTALVELGRWETTLVMTYSEFGRRVAQNGSNGTDHGTANAQFVMGGRVKGGMHGVAPSLDRLDGGNLIHSHDFRSYYATALERWWGLPSSRPLGGTFPPLELLRS